MKRTIPLAFLFLAFPHAALAQAVPALPPAAPPDVITEPKLPDNPQSPSDFQGPARAAAASEAGTQEAGSPPATGYSGGDMVITDTNPAMYDDASSRKAVPEYHTVAKGDSLWSICQTYYGDPWSWPQLWAYNRTITNPHWIFPGDRVRLLGAGAGPSSDEGVRITAVPNAFNKVIRLRQRAVVEDADIKKAASVLGSMEQKWMLTQFDEIYVRGGSDFKPTLGKLFTLYRIGDELKNSKGKKIGYVVQIVGTARIKRLTKGKAATAVILEAYSDVERGDLLGPLRRTYKTIPLRQADRDLRGEVVANLDDTEVVGEGQIVFLDNGKNQGVQLGNRFLVVHQGDGFETLIPEEVVEDDIKEFPEEAVAEISILDVRSQASMGIITRATREVRPGDQVRMRRGY